MKRYSVFMLSFLFIAANVHAGQSHEDIKLNQAHAVVFVGGSFLLAGAAYAATKITAVANRCAYATTRIAASPFWGELTRSRGVHDRFQHQIVAK